MRNFATKSIRPYEEVRSFMQNVIIFDSVARNHLLPLTATRPMGELRLGILTIREKWEKLLHARVSYITQEYLQDKYPIHIESDNLILNGGLLPTPGLLDRVRSLKPNEALIHDGELLASRISNEQIENLIGEEELHELQGLEIEDDIEMLRIDRLWDMTRSNDQALIDDFDLITSGRKSQTLSSTNTVLGKGSVFLEEGAQVECCVLNTTDGPIYIGANAQVMEGSMLRGPVSIGPESIVKMGARIYGPTTIGPGCRAGGEITRSILTGYSNKAHEGYLGDSVLGEWCNLGADTNNSNLKNNYSQVRLWDYETERFEKSGTQFLGLFMGDHSKCAINTMFNTGTVVGVFANVYGAGFPRNFIPDFSWGGADSGYRTYKFAEASEVATTVMARRKIEFDEMEKAILFHVYDRTAKYRSWDKEQSANTEKK